MRAINLVPADSRPGRVSAGKSGGAVYGVLALMVVMLLGLSVFAMSKRDEAKANQELATVEQSTEAYRQVASQYASFEAAAGQATQRINTVRSLAEARFDWAGAMRDLSRLVPKSTRVSALTASISPTINASGGASSAFRGQLTAPAISMTGCSLSQSTVATLITQLQAMRRVTNVTLEQSSTKVDAGAKADDVSSGCEYYGFDLVVFFAPGDAKAAADIAPSSSPTAQTISTEASGATTPPATPTAAGN